MMSIFCETLALSSLAGGKLGITGVAFIVLYFIGMYVAIRLIGRHEYYPEGFEIFTISVISLFSASIGFYIGYGGSQQHGTPGQGAKILIYALVFCGVASFLTSWKLLDYRLPHRIIISVIAPIILILSALSAELINQFVIELVF